MTDDRFAEHVREVFDAYHEPVDPGALARLQAELGHTPGPTSAPDRAPRRRQRGGRWRVLAALAALAVAVGGWLATRPGPSVPVVAQAVAPRADGTRNDPKRDPPATFALPSGEEETEPRAGRVSSSPRERASQAEFGADSEASAGRREASGARPASPPAGRGDQDTLVAAAETESQESLAESVAAQELGVESVPASVVAIMPLPPAASARPVRRVEPISPRPLAVRAEATERSGVRVVVATTSAFAAGQRAEGGGVSAGVSRDWRLGRGLTLSGGAAASYNRLAFDPDGVTTAQALDYAEQDPEVPVDVTTRSTLTTVALEIPLDLALDLAQTRRGRLSASAGLTSALYLAQAFEDQGARVVGEPFTRASGESGVALSSAPFETRETVGLGRLDLARQLNLGLGFRTAGSRPLAVDVYTRLPLGGLTSRDLALTTVGVRLRVPLR